MTIHGKGDSRRNFVHAYDVATAVETILLKGVVGEIYNIGTDNEYTVLEIAKLIVEKYRPGEKLEEWVEYVDDRPFNDFRYAIDSTKLRELGWKEVIDFTI
jgi:dTDP-D-glucose 4,6-dehydratase